MLSQGRAFPFPTVQVGAHFLHIGGDPRLGQSNAESLEIRDALLREFPVLLDKIVSDPALLRCGKCSYPVDAALTKRNLRATPGAATLADEASGDDRLRAL
ncbi:MAG: hypothetical protein HUU18_07735, partial [Phycisphaerales bacterium]|nr:hypothetical protein [Phycisphaerales bacterium]